MFMYETETKMCICVNCVLVAAIRGLINIIYIIQIVNKCNRNAFVN